VPIATRADLEAIRGPRYLEQLLQDATDEGGVVSAPVQDARLAAALDQGDNLIAQFFVITGITSTDPRWNVLRQFAIEEALYYLQRHSASGASEADHTAAMMRRQDLGHMRKREQFAGTPEGQRTSVPTTVSSGSPFALDKLVGLL
jgi:hypothetical protein